MTAIPGKGFGLKNPTKLKITINPTNLQGFHDTFLSQKDVPNVFNHE